MKKEGFFHLTGIDAFIEKNVIYDEVLKIIKAELCDLDGLFDFVMLNHSFEHIHNPFIAFQHINRILKKNQY